MTPSLTLLLVVSPSCLCCSGPFPFLNPHSKSCLFHSSFPIPPFITVMYAPVLSPLLDTLSIGLRTEVWLIFASVRALSIVTYTIHTAQWLDVWNLCLPAEANDLKVTISWRSPRVSTVWPELGWEGLTSIWKGYLWFLFTSGSGELWLHTHLTRPSFVTSLNISSALFCFLLLPFLPLNLTALWLALGFSNKLLLMRGLFISNLYFRKVLQ